MRTGVYVVIGAFAASTGCIPASAVSARASYESSLRGVRYRAAFDLDCPASEIEVRCIDVSAQSLERGALCIAAGTLGCGRRASYRAVVVSESGWNRRLVTWALEGMWSSEHREPAPLHQATGYFAGCRPEDAS